MEEFLAADVALGAVFLPGAFQREVKGLFQQKIGPRLEPLVALEDILDGRIEAQGLHL